MQKPYLSVIIPAYNEAKRIPATLLDIDRVLRKRAFTYEIIVVNDGSRDETAETARKLAKVVKNLKLIDNAMNQGKGGVVKQGMLMARGRYRLFTDADNSTSIDQFDNMIPYFRGEGGAGDCDVVVGSRAIKGSVLDPPQPFYRQIPGKLGNIFIQCLLLWGIRDTQCGFKAFTDDAAEKIFARTRITGWGFDVEVLALAKALGYRIREIPVVWKNDPFSHVRASAYLHVLLETIKIRWWLWIDAYYLRRRDAARG